jgi:hypothetical protein
LIERSPEYEARLAFERARAIGWSGFAHKHEPTVEAEEPLWRAKPEWLVPRYTRSGHEYFIDPDGTVVLGARAD